jgi:glutathione S-transferase
VRVASPPASQPRTFTRLSWPGLLLLLYAAPALGLVLVAVSAQFGVKFTAGFGKVMFASDAAAATSGIDELNGSLQWVEGELSKSEGPFFMGQDFTLVRHTGPMLHRLRRLSRT